MVFASSQHQFVFSPLRWGRIHADVPISQAKYANGLSSHASEGSNKLNCHSEPHTKHQKSTLVHWHSLWRRVSNDMRASLSSSFQDFDDEEDDTLENIPTCYDIPVDTRLYCYLRHQSQQSAKLATSLNNIAAKKTPVVPLKPLESSEEEYSAALSTLLKLQDSNRPLRELLHIKQVQRTLQKNKDQCVALREMEWYKIQILEQGLCGGRALAVPKRTIHNVGGGETSKRRRPSYGQQTMVTSFEPESNLATTYALNRVRTMHNMESCLPLFVHPCTHTSYK